MFKDLFKISKYFVLPIIVYGLSWIFYFFGFFESINWFDDFFHIFGGAVIGYSFYFSLNYFESKKDLRLNGFFRGLFVISLIALIAVFWEFYEFYLEMFTNIPTQPSLEDTLFDLFLGIFGGFLLLILLELKDYIASE